jgi:hypothetical protein
MPKSIHDPSHWRNRAAEMRALSKMAVDTWATMQKLADDYDKLADDLARRNGGEAMPAREAGSPLTTPMRPDDTPPEHQGGGRGESSLSIHEDEGMIQVTKLASAMTA